MNSSRRIWQENGWLIQVKNLEEAVKLTNQLAPEHCEVMMRGAAKVAEKIVTAGAIFLGPWSPTVLGDYVAGPSHTLPTGGAGASFAGLTVDQFQRRTSVVEYDRVSLKKGSSGTEEICRSGRFGCARQIGANPDWIVCAGLSATCQALNYNSTLCQ